MMPTMQNVKNWSDIEQAIGEVLMADGAQPMLVNSFLRNAKRVYDGDSGLISETDITPIDSLPDFATLPAPNHQDAVALLKQTAMIKLNGGLGTSMGLEKAKSLLPVKNGLTFLDIIARQVLQLRKKHNVAMPLLFMTSFSTDRDTLDALAAYPDLSVGLPFTFLQHRVPKLLSDSLLPATHAADPDKAWCPPGHGDLYAALITSGMLGELLRRGFRFVFVSNADNLGAVIDAAIPALMARENIPFLVEVADRTSADRKGGHLARDKKTGRLLLRELAQCPPEASEQFQDINRYRYFNTNNLWIDLVALNALVEQTGSVPACSLIINRKTLDPRDEKSAPVLQLETAMCSAIVSFEGAAALRVPKTRFAPVKTTDELLGLWSDAFILTEDMHVQLAPERAGMGPPVVKLDPAYYKKIDDFKKRFPRGAPSLIKCRSLTVQGDHTFSPEQVFEGDLEIKKP
jgi:UTP--glucose-1-phosphate uridylyltransferase